MAVELATGYVSIVPSTSNFGRTLGAQIGGDMTTVGADAGKRFGSSFASSLGPAVKGLAATAAAAFAVDFTGDAVKAASGLAETISKNRAVFGDQAAAVEQFAANAASGLGQSKQQALEAAASFGNMFNQLGLGTAVSADMSKNLTGLASDFASFHNADISQVLEAQTAAFRGEYDALQRFVPTINAAAVEQKALAQTGKKATAELTAQEKAAATYALMLEGAGKAAGDFGRTSDGLANQQRILSAQFENAKAGLGSALLPVLTAGANLLNDTVIPAFSDLGAIFRDEGFGGVLSKIGGELQAAPPVVQDALAQAGAALLDFIVEQGPVALDALGGLVGSVGRWAAEEGLPALGDGIRVLVPALVDWIATDAIPAIARELPGIVQAIGDFILTEAVPALLGLGVDLGAALLDGIGEAFGAGVNWATDMARDVVNAMIGFINKEVIDRINDLLEFSIDPPGPGPKLSINPPDLPGIPLIGRQHGGPVTAGQPYVVGERRPELFVPDTNGTILPEVPGFGSSGITVQVIERPGESSALTAVRELRRLQLLAAP